MEDCMVNEPERYTLPWEVEEEEGPDWRFIVCAGCAQEAWVLVASAYCDECWGVM